MWRCPNCESAATFCGDRRPWPAGWRCGACGFRVRHYEDIPCLAPDLIGTDSGFNPALFESLMRFEETSFWFVNRAKLIVSMMRKHFPAARNFLEVGCGTGSVLLALTHAVPDLKVTGSELHPEGLACARRRLDPEVALLQMDARSIPAREHFDVVGAFDVIEHIPEDQRVLDQIYAVLQPGGGAIIAVPQHPWLWSPADDAARHQRRYARGELEQKLTHVGFRILESTSFNAVLLPLMIVSRQLAKARVRSGAEPNPLSEFEIPGWLNGILSMALEVETGLTVAGIRWPVGGSRFVVAQK
jgi:ubiquinone/menaquinone biosynthesis C-methylase UbiE